LHVLLLIFCVT